MEGSRFDAWTRRRFGVVAGGLAASLLSLNAPATVARRKNKKKKRCRKESESCGGKKKCCKDLRCATVGIGVLEVCCRDVRQACTDEPGQCCGNRACMHIDGLSGIRCCGVIGSPCRNTGDCCSGHLCNNEGQCIGG